MATPKRQTPTGISTNYPSDPLNRSKNYGPGSALGGYSNTIPEQMTSSIESQRKVEIIQKIENLFPFLQDIMGQNDARSNTIINRLIGLRESLDQIFEEIGDEIGKTEDENEGLKNEIRRIQDQRVSHDELLEHKRNGDRQMQRLNEELQHLRRKEDESRTEIESLKKENEKAFYLLDAMKKSSEELLNKNRQLAARGASEEELEVLKGELEAEKRKSMGIEEFASKKMREYERAVKD
jgi:chromosome segregation ATPase